MLPPEPVEITHAMIHAELSEIRRRGDERETMLAQISHDLVAVKDVVDAMAAIRTGGRFLIWLGKMLVAAGLVVVAVKAGFSAAVDFGAE